MSREVRRLMVDLSAAEASCIAKLLGERLCAVLGYAAEMEKMGDFEMGKYWRGQAEQIEKLRGRVNVVRVKAGENV